MRLTDPRRLGARSRRDSGRKTGRGGSRHARQAEHDGVRLWRISPEPAGAGQPVGSRSLAGRVVKRVRGGDGRRALLCITRFRHGRVDPLPVGGVRDRRRQADVRARQPVWRLPSGGIAGPHRPHDPHRRRCRRGPRSDRRFRSARPDHTARFPARLSHRPRSGPTRADDRAGRAVLHGGDRSRGDPGRPRRGSRVSRSGCSAPHRERHGHRGGGG